MRNMLKANAAVLAAAVAIEERYEDVRLFFTSSKMSHKGQATFIQKLSSQVSH